MVRRPTLALLALLSLFALTMVASLALHRLPAFAARGARAAPAPRLLVLVISSREPVYSAHRAVWRMLAEAAAPHAIKVYFIVASADVESVVVTDDEIISPGADCLRPCIMAKTINSLAAIVGEGAPAHAYEYVLRTNLSSLWVWARLVAWLDAKLRPRGTPVMAARIVETTDILSGAGTIWSVDVARMLIAGNASLEYGELDDVAMSSFLHRKRVPVEEMARTDFASDAQQPLSTLPPAALDTGAYHYRIKSSHDRERHDGLVMARLFAEAYYGDAAAAA